NAVAKVRVRSCGGLDQEDLVGADAEMAIGQGTRALRRHVDGLAYAVEHDKVVAGAVHFGEIPDHGGIIAHYAYDEGTVINDDELAAHTVALSTHHRIREPSTVSWVMPGRPPFTSCHGQ